MIHLGIQAARALGVAHEAGIVHRDVKPDNLMITSRRVLKLVDLGLAKCSADDASQTRTGQMMGTPNYISPEQILGDRELDGRADLYSLGASLYYLVDRRLPFNGIVERPHHVAPPARPGAGSARARPDLDAGLCCALDPADGQGPRRPLPGRVALEQDLVAIQRGERPTAAASSRPGDLCLGAAGRERESAASGAGTSVRRTGSRRDLGSIETALAAAIGPVASVLVRQSSRPRRRESRASSSPHSPGRSRTRAPATRSSPPATHARPPRPWAR